MRPQDLPILPYLYPQATMRVSPIFRIHPYWFMRNGSIVHAESTMQFFYSPDGTISFVVLGAEQVSMFQL